MTHLCDAITVAKFDMLVTAVRSVCGFDSESHSNKLPSLALKLGYSLKEV